MFPTIIDKKKVHTWYEYITLLRKLHKAGFKWCNGDSLVSDYEPEVPFPIYIFIHEEGIIHYGSVRDES